MGKFTGVEMVGLRDKETKKIIAVYPYKAEGTDTEINKIVRDWYYQQNCAAEDKLLTAYVDVLNENEIKSQIEGEYAYIIQKLLDRTYK